jgi:hypothetical protein
MKVTGRVEVGAELSLEATCNPLASLLTNFTNDEILPYAWNTFKFVKLPMCNALSTY